MANSHILEQLAPGRFRVVYHVAIPATNNAAGVPWRPTTRAGRVAANGRRSLRGGWRRPLARGRR
jgi:hypothetical protein